MSPASHWPTLRLGRREPRAAAETAPWHYVDVPLDEPKYDRRFSGEKNGCVVDKINEFRKVMRDKSKSIEDRRFALRFLIHCVEDMHLPCHVGDNHDKGGNQTQVRFFDRGTNMHRVWDGSIIERAGTTEDFWLNDLAALDTPENRAAWMKGTVEDWATESLAGRTGGLPGPADRQADQVGHQAWRRVPGEESAGRQAAARSSGDAAGDGAQRERSREVSRKNAEACSSEPRLDFETALFLSAVLALSR